MVEITVPKHIREEAAHELGVSGRTLQDYLQQGAPQGPKGTLDVEAIRAWCADHKRKGGKAPDEDATERTKAILQNRRLRALAEKTEIENAEQRGELVPKEDVRAMLIARIYEIVQAFEAVEAEGGRRFGVECSTWLAGRHRGIRERFGRPTPHDELTESGQIALEVEGKPQESASLLGEEVAESDGNALEGKQQESATASPATEAYPTDTRQIPDKKKGKR